MEGLTVERHVIPGGRSEEGGGAGAGVGAKIPPCITIDAFDL